MVAGQAVFCRSRQVEAAENDSSFNWLIVLYSHKTEFEELQLSPRRVRDRPVNVSHLAA